MLGNFEPLSSYSTFSEKLYKEFLEPCFQNSQTYDRAAGYFSSSIFSLGPLAFTEFFQRGGRVRLVCSPHLSTDDQNAIKNLENEDFQPLEEVWSNTVSEAKKSEIPSLTSRFLAALIRNGYLELRIARFKRGSGLFHDKVGIFSDSDWNSTSFTGSANETLSAWSGVGNHESIDVFRSWVESEKDRVTNHQNRFNSFWEGEAEGLEVLSGQEAANALLARSEDEDLDQITEELKTKIFRDIATIPNRPKPRNYQTTAIENWQAAGNRGVISFATGGGKTLTALHCANKWLSGDRVVVVLLPSSILVSQWFGEVQGFFPDAQILKADSKGLADRKKLIKDFLRPNAKIDLPRFVLATYKGAQSESFLAELRKNETRLMLIGDEVHKFGATESRKIGDGLRPAASLGLSATPLRNRDDEGTEAIYKFFGSQLKPLYTLSEAIKDGNLSPYRFEFEEARLTDQEQSSWDDLTEKIGKMLGGEDREQTLKTSPALERLLIARARISKLSKHKVQLAAKKILDTFKQGDRYLAYCETEQHVEDLKAELLSLGSKITTMTYLASNEVDHNRVMQHFEQEGGLIVAIRCLDEGVDIPAINKAVILSSSQSEREFIQRRGRLLRKYPGKIQAELFDFVTMTAFGELLQDAELIRLKQFAVDAKNPAALAKLEQLAVNMNVDLDGGIK